MKIYQLQDRFWGIVTIILSCEQTLQSDLMTACFLALLCVCFVKKSSLGLLFHRQERSSRAGLLALGGNLAVNTQILNSFSGLLQTIINNCN